MTELLIDELRPRLKDAFIQRWRIPDWELHFPWWRKPARCRILMYADGSVHLSGGSFQGLTYVKTLLESRAYPWVDFAVDFCHRNGTDPSATVNPGVPTRLSDLDLMNRYDQVWLFGMDEGANLDAAEVAAMQAFMAAPKHGGVLTTGDHASLGQGLSGPIPRVAAMRLYPAPPASWPQWNTTLVRRPPMPGEPADPPANAPYLNFDDQSDDQPQAIRWKRYAVSPLRSRPHPLLCGPDGPIDVLPDHQHEGEAIAPAVAGDANWPSLDGHQEAPEVIAWGRIQDPSARKHGQEIGLVSVYNGHRVDVGRIVADSTWHHWFDINLLNIPGVWPYTGLDATPAGQATLKKIDAYFLNCGVWLAPPAVQQAMRSAAWWSTMWQDIVVELPRDGDLRLYGAAALDALGRRAPRCTVFDWVWPKEPIYKPKIPWWEWIELTPRLDLVDLPVEHYLAGGILHELVHRFGMQSGRRTIADGPPSDAELADAMQRGADRAMATLRDELGRQAELLTQIVRQDFRLSHEAGAPRRETRERPRH